MDCELDIPSRVIIGADTRTRVVQEVGILEWSRVLIVSDPFHEKAGRISEIAQLLSKADLEVSTCTCVDGEPDTEMVRCGF